MTHELFDKVILPETIPSQLRGIYRDFHPIQSQLLYKRNIVTKDQIDTFFSDDLNKIPDFRHLHGAAEAAKLILSAVKDNKKIFIHGDFDVDGVCGTCILWEYLYRQVSRLMDKKIDVVPYIPDRIDEGYGLSEKSVNAMLEKGAEVIITVDCGIRDRDLINKYTADSGVQFVLTDHHQLPDAFRAEEYNCIVVHQQVPEKQYPYEKICGSLISFLIVQAIKHEVGEDIRIDEHTHGLDLVGLATVTDIMPLIDINRILLINALKQINHSERVGLRELIEVAGLRGVNIDSYHLGFVIGPRLNAAGRLGSAMDALRLLATNDVMNAKELSHKLDNLNKSRQDMTDSALLQARSDAKTFDNKLIFVAGENWSEGIVGLVAGKLQEEFGKPVIVVTQNEKEVRGSARSIPNFNITSAIEKFAQYLVKYGGHAQAAGFTLKNEFLNEFRKALVEYCNNAIDSSTLQRSIDVDMLLGLQSVDIDLVKMLETFSPFGYGNRKPLLLVKDAVIIDKLPLGKTRLQENIPKHMKLVYKSDAVGLSEAIMFDSAEDFEKIGVDDVIDIIGTADVNEWRGSISPQFQVKWWRKAGAD